MIFGIFKSMAREKIEMGPTGRTVAKNLRRLRVARELSLRELADKAEDAGRKFGVNALSQAEKGQRRLDVDDLVALATVLGVNPNALMLPVEIDRERPIEMTGQSDPLAAERAWRWFLGETPLPGQGPRESEFRLAVNPWWVMARGFPDGTQPDDLWALWRYMDGDEEVTPEDFPDHFSADEVRELLRYAEQVHRFQNGDIADEETDE